MEILDARVKTGIALRFPFEPIRLIPIGDVQLGAPGCAESAFRRWLDHATDTPYPVRFIGMGDYIDIMSPSNRGIWQGSKLYDSVHLAVEEKVEEHIDRFVKLVEGTKGKWLGMLEGHHYFVFGDGTTSDMRLCSRLGTRFLGDCAMLRLSFRKGQGSGTSQALTVWLHHGEGSGTSIAAPMNKLAPLAGRFDARLFLIGHFHAAQTLPVAYITLSRFGRPLDRMRQLVSTGGWLASYVAGSKADGRAQGNYAEQRMLPPLPLKGTTIDLIPRTIHRQGQIDTDIEMWVTI